MELELIEWQVVVLAIVAAVVAIAVTGGVAVWIHTSQISRRTRLLLEHAGQQTQYLRDIAGAINGTPSNRGSATEVEEIKARLGIK